MSIHLIRATSAMENLTRMMGEVTRKVYVTEREINAVTDVFRRGNIGVLNAEHEYAYTYGNAVDVSRQVADLAEGVNLVEMLPPLSRAAFPELQTDRIFPLKNRMDAALRRFTNVFLTHFPTAKINYGPFVNYGSALIGPVAELSMGSTQPSRVRRIRDDGNAFLSAVATRFLEELIQQGVVESFIEFVANTDCDANLKQKIITILRSIQANPSELEATLQNNDEMLPFINFLRRVAAQEMLANKPLYESALRSDMQWIPFANREQPYEELVNQYVLQMGTQCVPSMMAAVCKMLAFQVNIDDSWVGTFEGRNILAEGAPRAFFVRQVGANCFVRYPEQLTTTTTAPTQQPVAIQEIPAPTAATIEVAVKFNAGYGNNLFVRGNVPGMS